MSDSGIQSYQSLDNINSLLSIKSEQEMSQKISQNIPKLFQIFNSFKTKLNFSQVSNNDISQILEALKFIDTLNLFMDEMEVRKLKEKMREIRDLLLKRNYDFSGTILRQITYTEMTMINHKKLYFRNLYFNNHKGLSAEIESEIDQVYKNNKFDFRLFKQMQNIFWVVKNVLDENKKMEIDNRLKNMKIESQKIKEKKYGGNSYMNRGYNRNDNYINDYNDHKNYSGYDYIDNFINDDYPYYSKNYSSKSYHHGGRGGYMNNINRKYYIKKQEEKEIEIPSDPSYYNKNKENEIKMDEIDINNDNNDNIQPQENNNNFIKSDNDNNINKENNLMTDNNNNIDDINPNGEIRNEINNVQNNNLDLNQNNEINSGNGEIDNINLNNDKNMTDTNKNDDIEIIANNSNSFNRNKKKTYPNKMIAVELPSNEESNINNNINEENNNTEKIENTNNDNNIETNINTNNNYSYNNYNYNNYNGENNIEYKQYNNDFRENKYKNYYYNNGYKSNSYNKNGYRNNNYNRYNMRNNISGNNYGDNNQNKKLLFVEIDANNNPIENKVENDEIIKEHRNEINENNNLEKNNEQNSEIISNNIKEINKEENPNINVGNKEDENEKQENKVNIEIKEENNNKEDIQIQLNNEENKEKNNEIKQENIIEIKEENLNEKKEEKEEKEIPKVEGLKSISENIELNPEDDLNTKISKSDSHINKINAISFKDIKDTEFKNIPEKTEENLQEIDNLPQENEEHFEEEEDEIPENLEGQFKAFMIEAQGIEPKGSFKLMTNNNSEENEENENNELENNFDENDLDEHINADIENENLIAMNDVEQEKEIKLKECMNKLNIPKIIKDALDELEEEERQLRLKILHKLDDNYKNQAINPKYTFYNNEFFKQNSQMFSNELNDQIKEYRNNPAMANIPLFNYIIGKFYNNFPQMKENDIIRDYIDLKVKEIEHPEYIWNNMQNFEKKILIPLYQKTIENRKKKYKLLNNIYSIYERCIKIIFQNSKDLDEVKKFGSFSNTFMIDFGESDIDICLVPKCHITYFRNTYIDKLIHGLKNNKLGTFKEITTNENYNSCIVLKGEYNEKSQKINICIVINNKIPIYHSILLRLYALYDQRFHIMGIYLKYWAKINGLHGPNYLPSYALLFMIIHFLQKVVEPKVLPNLQKIPIIDSDKNISEPRYEQKLYEYVHEYKTFTTNIYYETDTKKIKEYMTAINNNKINKETVTNLLIKFFEYYSYCYDSNQKISIHKDLIESIKKGDDNIAYSIDDPFDIMNNPGKNLEKDSESCKKFVKAMKKEINLILSGEYVKRLELEKERLSRINKK